jgi:hypothetical protein
MIQVNKNQVNPQIFKKIENSTPSKAIINKEVAKQVRGEENSRNCLGKSFSKTRLTKKGGERINKFKK